MHSFLVQGIVFFMVSTISTINGEFFDIVGNKNQMFVEQMIANARRVMDVFHRINVISNQQVSLVHEGSLKLTGHTSEVLQFQHNGTWAVICVDNFDRITARVACRQLGLEADNFMLDSVSILDSSTTSFLWMNVSCRGGESQLQYCNLNLEMNSGSCGTNGQIVSLNCNDSHLIQIQNESLVNQTIRLTGSTVEGTGYLEVFNGSEWQAVSANNFQQISAHIACKNLGFNYSKAVILPGNDFEFLNQSQGQPNFQWQYTSNGFPISNSLPIQLPVINVNCQGNEINLSDCKTSPSVMQRKVSISCIGSEIPNISNVDKLRIAIAMNDELVVERLLTMIDDKTLNSHETNCCAEIEVYFGTHYASDKNTTLLLCAVCYGSSRSARLLVERGANISAQSPYLGTPLILAVHQGFNDIAKMLVEVGNASVKLTTSQVDNALTVATRRGNIDMVEFLVEHGADVNADELLGNGGMSPLMHAALRGNFEIVKYLVENGAHIDAYSFWSGNSALSNAASSGNLNVVKYLIENAGDTLDLDSFYLGDKCLRNAVIGQHWHIVKFLIEIGCRVDTPLETIEGTALTYAAGLGNLEMVQFLVSNGAFINSTWNGRVSPILEASKAGHLEIVKFLVGNGAYFSGDPNELLYETSPLAFAAENGHLEIVKYLVEELGENVNGTIMVYSYISPLTRALSQNHSEVAKFLIEKGAAVNVESGDNFPLLSAVSNENFELVKILISNGANVNYLPERASSALMKAVFTGNFEIVKYLVENGAQVDARNKQNDSAFVLSVSGHRLEIAKYLIEHGADVNHPGQIVTPLVYAAGTEQSELVQYLIGHGANVSAEDKYGNTALHYATSSGNFEMVKLLVEKGAPVNNTKSLLNAVRWRLTEMAKYLVEHGADVDGRSISYDPTPLMQAASNGDFEMVKYLVENGADVNYSNYEFNEKPLMRAAENGHFEMVKYLIEHGANANDTFINHKATALSFAAKSGSLETVRYLVEQGNANVSASANLVGSPLAYAALNGSIDVSNYLLRQGAEADRFSILNAAQRNKSELVRLLIENGANVNSHTNDHTTPLFYAASNSNFEMVKYLVENGSFVNVTSLLSGETALITAIKAGSLDIVKYLVEYGGADVNQTDGYRQTPRSFADQRGFSEISEYLTQHGAIAYSSYPSALIFGPGSQRWRPGYDK